MGRMLGSFSDDQELDRPDLNKCPDCDCFFASDACPLCKKICPEEMRAGNRKPVKPRKVKRRKNSSRTQFISWYHQWWFIVILFLVMPLAGLVVLFTSPHKFWKKILFVAIYLLFPVIISFTLMLGGFTLDALLVPEPVDTSLSREEYIAKCEVVTPEEFYRSPGQYEDGYVCITLMVDHVCVVDSNSYYVCHDPANTSFVIVFADYLQDGKQNFIKGDIVTIYGQPSGNANVNNADGQEQSAPWINAAYAVINTD